MIIHSLLVSLLNFYDFVFLCFMLFPWCFSSNQTRFNYYNFSTAKNCAELFKGGQRISGFYTIYLDDKPPFDVYCDQTRAGGGWTVIQKRLNGFVDFNRNWVDYKDGFGNFLIREYWLGLEKIHRLTRNKTEKLFTMSTNGLVLRMRQLITGYASAIFHLSQSILP